MVNKDGKWGTGARGQWGKWETLCRLWSQPLLVSSSPPLLSPVLTPAELQRRQHKLHQGSPCSGCYPGRMEQNLEQHRLKLWWDGGIFLLLSHLFGQKLWTFPSPSLDSGWILGSRWTWVEFISMWLFVASISPTYRKMHPWPWRLFPHHWVLLLLPMVFKLSTGSDFGSFLIKH